MIGFHLFKHAAMMVINNWRDALKIGLVPALTTVAAIFLFLGTDVITSSGLNLVDGFPNDDDAGVVTVFALLLMIVTYGGCMLWAFVNWHRFVLLEEYPTGWVSPVRKDRMLAYFGQGVLIFVVVLVLAAAFTAVGSVAVMLLPSDFVVVVVPLYIVISIAFVVFSYRLSVILPAAAIGQRMTLSQALEATKGANVEILILLVSQALFQVALQVVAILSLTVFLPLGIVFQVMATLFQTVLGVSVLTTLYGYYVEKRELDE